jgi:hypothetical protein
MILTLLGCVYTVDEGGVLRDDHLRPRLVVGESTLSFGELAVGESARAEVPVRNGGDAPLVVTLGRVDPLGSFCTSWASGPATCPEGEGEAAPDPGDVACPDEADRTLRTVTLGPGCTLDAVATFVPAVLGDLVAGLELTTPLDAPVDDLDVPGGDPREPRQFVVLAGVGAEPAATSQLTWAPPLAELEWHWPDGTARAATATLQNVGDADATFAAFDTSGCTGLSVTAGPAAGDVVAAGASVPVTLSFVAFDDGPYACVLRAASAAGDVASMNVVAPLPVASAPPTVTITSPLPGDAVDQLAGVTVRAVVADDLAPPAALAVAVELLGGTAPPETPVVDTTGAATVTFAPDTFALGPGVVEVRVTDREGNVGRASVTVRNGAAAADDGDADGWGLAEGDCADDDPDRYPGAIEFVDGLDQDCDGTVDNDTTAYDDDGDGTSEADGDCDDADAARHPGVPELGNGVDDDCDGTVDEGHRSGDGDGDGFTEDQGDCDDRDADRNPFAADVCNGFDDDCDGAEPDRCPPSVPPTLVYLDVSPDVCVPGEAVVVRPAAVHAEVGEWASSADVTFFRENDGAAFVCPDAPERTAGAVYARTAWGALVTADVVVEPDAGQAALDWRSGPPIVVTACNPTGSASALGLVLLAGAAGVRRRATGSGRSRAPRPHTPSRRR